MAQKISLKCMKHGNFHGNPSRHDNCIHCFAGAQYPPCSSSQGGSSGSCMTQLQYCSATTTYDCRWQDMLATVHKTGPSKQNCKVMRGSDDISLFGLVDEPPCHKQDNCCSSVELVEGCRALAQPESRQPAESRHIGGLATSTTAQIAHWTTQCACTAKQMSKMLFVQRVNDAEQQDDTERTLAPRCP